MSLPVPPGRAHDSGSAEVDSLPWLYQTDGVIIVPYVETKLPEAMLVEVYAKLKIQKSLETTFCSGTTITLNEFIRRMSTARVLLALERPSLEPMAVGWLSEVRCDGDRKLANVGCAAFRKFWGSPRLAEAAKLALRFWFDGDGVSRLYGSCLASNRSALRFAERVGFERTGTMPEFFSGPNGIEDAILVSVGATTYGRTEQHRKEPVSTCQ